MRISIFGMGYVGVVSAACLTKDGHEVVGVDPVEKKVDLLNKGLSPIVEEDVGELIARAVEDGKFKVTTNTTEAVHETSLSFVCVGTPSQLNGKLDLKYVRRVCEKIGCALKNKDARHVVVIRSTVLPGTIQNVVIPAIEDSSGKKGGRDFGVCVNPEFMREGTAVHDFYHPAKTVIGESDKDSGDMLASIYKDIDSPIIRTDFEVAEMAKYADNAWHALKVGFANEIGNICKEIGIDGHKVMDVFCQDTKLNISPSYLKPGFAFGGSCLPKDLRALNCKASDMGLDLPILNSIIASNNMQIERGLQMIVEKESKKVGVLGLSFKACTDDMRESPMVELTKRLLVKEYDVRIYDSNVNIGSLLGGNRDYILDQIPNVSRIMVDSVGAVMKHADILVIGNDSPEFMDVPQMLTGNQTIVDLVRIGKLRSDGECYDGICW